MPQRNEVDLEELPKDIKEKLHFVFVRTMDEVLKAALEPKGMSPNMHKANVRSGKSRRKARRKAKARA